MKINPHLSISGEKILIIGNRSYKNLGDELIVLGTIKLLQKQKKAITISCYNPKRLKTFFLQFFTPDKLANITFIHELPKGLRSAFSWFKNGGLKELKYFRKTDTIILGGGEIITEENPSAYRYRLVSIRPFLLRHSERSEESMINKDSSLCSEGHDLYIMGGIQTPTSQCKLKLFKFLLNHTTHLYLRDFQAVEEIKNLGYPNIEFFMDTSYFAYNWSAITKQPHNDKYLMVNLNKNGEQFIDDIANDISKYLKQGYTIYYVPVAKGSNQYYQDIHYKKLLEKKLTQPLQVIDREYNFKHFVQMIKGAEIVISTRLHLFLIASFLGVPTKVYPYQKKILKMQEVIKKLI